MNWLVVLIAAPLASFGEEPGNARRGTADRPTRSALLGLAGAALGVERDDVDGQRALAASFLTATRTLVPGAPLADFHTFQSLPESKGPVATRADALARRGDLETSITRRDYRSDGRWQAAFVERDVAAISLQILRQAFLRPRFALWAGRKSCPLSHPLAPTILEADGVEKAFAAHLRIAELEASDAAMTIALDARLAPPAGVNNGRRLRRLDEPGDRTRWHFSSRHEIVFRAAPSTETEA
jgi:CRISPR system Cascade subunit CasD